MFTNRAKRGLRINLPNKTLTFRYQEIIVAKELTACGIAIATIPTLRPYVSAMYAYIDTPNTAERHIVLAIHDNSASDNGLSSGDTSACNSFVIGEIQPVCNP